MRIPLLMAGAIGVLLACSVHPVCGEDIGPNSWKPAGHTDDCATAMPVGICLAATWDAALAYREGQTIGQEARARKNIMLGPGVNILRTPLDGRGFEFFGEDPSLASQICVGYIRGEQSADGAFIGQLT